MSTVRQPAGSPPPSVYRRRRVVALVLALLLFLLLAWAATAIVGALRGEDDATTTATAGQASQEPSGEPAPSSTPASSEPESSEPESSEPESSAPAAAPSESAGGSTDCPAEVVSVVATADQPSYTLGGAATVGMTITNTGSAACQLDAGSAALELMVVSGEDRIWSSDDCQEAEENRPTTVEPGEAGALASSVQWPLERSAEGCSEDLPALRPGTYQLSARAGEIISAPLVLTIEG